MRVEKAAAGKAPQARAWDERIGVRKYVALHVLFLTSTSAPLAAELPVERVQFQDFGVQDVLLALKGFPYELRVHRLEVHVPSLEHRV